MRVLLIIPARGGSKRLPHKNTIPLLGRPLLAYAVDAARRSRLGTRCVVSSDDEQILAFAREIDPSLPLVRPAELARDDSPTIDAIRHAVAFLEGAGEARFDAAVTVQATNPLVVPADIDACIERLAAGADSAVTITRVGPMHPSKFKRVSDGWLVPYFSESVEIPGGRGQDLPDAFLRNGSVYATRREILDRNILYGDRVAGVEVARERFVDIDEPSDLAYAEFLLTRRRP